MSFQPDMAEHQGSFGRAVASDTECRFCKATTVTEKKWESSCGGWVDWKYTCGTCQKTWWVEGIDS